MSYEKKFIVSDKKKSLKLFSLLDLFSHILAPALESFFRFLI